jgi:phage terminase small subunit
MGVISPPKMEAFAQEIAKGKTIEEAGAAAGYVGTSMASGARRRSQNPKVRARVREIREKIAAMVVVDQFYVQRRLMEIADTPFDPSDVRASDIIQALKTLMDLNGLKAPEKHDVSLTSDLARRLDEAIKRANAIDVTPARPRPAPSLALAPARSGNMTGLNGHAEPAGECEQRAALDQLAELKRLGEQRTRLLAERSRPKRMFEADFQWREATETAAREIAAIDRRIAEVQAKVRGRQFSF